MVFGLDGAALAHVRPLLLHPGPNAEPSSSSGDACLEALAAGRVPDASVDRDVLWPPNHALVDVGLEVRLGACSSLASVGLAVWSDEPQDGNGDGSTAVDAHLDPPRLFLRRERQGPADGRVYLLIATAARGGTASTDCETVVVPHSQSRAAKRSVQAQAEAAEQYCESGNAAPPGFHRLAEGFLVRANEPPLVDAGPDLAIEPGTSAALDGTVTDDGLPAGSELDVSWSKVSGPGTVTFSSPHSPDTSAAFSETGTYVLRLLAREVLECEDGQGHGHHGHHRHRDHGCDDDCDEPRFGLSGHDEVSVVVSAANAAPSVSAGPDLTLTLPTQAVALQGSATDDGRPSGTLTVGWTVIAGPGAVAFDPPGVAAPVATFDAVGAYRLRLAASDGQLSAFDDVTVTLNPEALPVLAVADADTTEGHEAVTGAVVEMTLSKPWPRPVSVDYTTADGSATAGCDYRSRFGRLTLPAGETRATVLVPVVGEVVPEADETVLLRVGNASEATLARDEAVLTLVNDDAANAEPPALTARAPADGTTGAAVPTLLSWSASDPDPGATLRHDVYLGTTFGTTGQGWQAVCPATPGPPSRSGAVSAYDEAGDRLMVFGGRGEESAGVVWVLAHATAAGGVPRWLTVETADGPGALDGATGAYDPGTNRLIVHGGCVGACSRPEEATWILTNASGLGGPSEWIRLAVAGPGPRAGHASAYDARTNRLIVFGGTDGVAERADAWVLYDANGIGQPAWHLLSNGEGGPAPRSGSAAVFDAASNRLLVVGGRAGATAFNDVWALRVADGAGAAATWAPLAPSGTPPGRRWGHAAAYEPASRRLLVFGGSTAGTESGLNFVFGDVWLLDGAGEGEAPAWVRVTAAGGPPAARYQPVHAYAPGANRLVVALGANNKLAADPADVWTLADAMGSLPVASSDQEEAAYLAEDLVAGARYYWRVVSRDEHGAWRGSPPWSFTSNRAPAVDAGPGQTITLPAAAALLGTAGDDGLPAGAILAVRWSVAGGPGAVSFADSASAATVATFSAPGSYVLRLEATDSQLGAADEMTVTVLPAPEANGAPVVDAGPDQALLLPARTAALAGSVTDDGRPAGVLGASWSQLAGPGTVSFADPSQPATVATFSLPGRYVLELAASDSALAAADTLEVTVAPRSDLTVRSVDVSAFVVDGQTLVAAGVLAAVVANDGAGPAGRPFALSFFEDRNTSGAYEPAEDVLLGTASLPDLAAGGTTVASAPVEGSVLFRGNVVHAFVDSGRAVAESDESNNHAASGPPCEDAPAPVPFAPSLKWSWTGSPVEPASRHVMATPAVVDLDGDGAPEVVFHSFRELEAGAVTHGGRLRVLRGSDGAEVFTVADPAHAVAGLSQVAVGDIDGDGRPEIVSVHEAGNRLIAFEHDGTFKWLSTEVNNGLHWGGASLADLDGDHVPEIVVGRTVFNADGTLRWVGSSSEAGQGTNGPIGLVADLDLDGSPEVVAGSAAYRASGQIAYFTLLSNHGFNAVGNFDDDPFAEVVLVENGRVHLLEHDGRRKWGPVAVPGGGHGGPPTVADFDGDGQPEIGIAAAGAYSVLEADGTVKWLALVQDFSSNATGSSVFDFEADGSPEVIYADELKLRIFKGTDGAVLWEVPRPSLTAHEYPVIADLDGDGGAEIVVGSDTIFFPGTPGLHVYGDSGERWVRTRRIWNQHAYHITNVNGDGTIPPHERPGWLAYNNYRQNRLTSGCEYAKPDLAPSYVRTATEAGSRAVTARVGNGGGSAVPPGLPVSFYDGDPRAGGTLLGTVATAAVLRPEGFEDVTLTLEAARRALPLWVVADDLGNGSGTVAESDEANNAYDSRVFLTDTPNQRPQVDAGPDRSTEAPAMTVALDATVTDDGLPVGTLGFAWGKVSGPGDVAFGTATAEDTTATFSVPGAYVLRLTASDADLTHADDVAVVVYPENQPPSVDAGPDRVAGTASITVSGSVVDDGLPAGGALGIAWSVVEAPGAVTFGSPAAAATLVTFGAEGRHLLRLTASDGRETRSDDVVVDFVRQNQAPTVGAGADRTLTLPANEVALDGSVADDGLPLGAAVSARWSLVSGPPAAFADAAVPDTVVRLTDPGTYVLRLRGSDGRLAAFDDVTVTVLPAPAAGDPPLVSLSSPSEGMSLSGPTPVVGSVSSASLASWRLESRLQGEPEFQRFGFGTAPVTAAELATFDPTLRLNGIHEVRLVATDVAGRSAAVSVHVVVRDNLKVGHFSVSFVDLEVPVAGLPIRVTRTYDSRDKGKGDFGHGWRLELSTMRVAENGTGGLGWQGVSTGGFFPAYCLPAGRPHVVTVTLPGGRVQEFEMVVSPACQPFIPPDLVTVSYRPRPGSLGSLAPMGDREAWVAGSWPGNIELFAVTQFDLFDPTAYEYTAPDGRKFVVHESEGVKR
ncbi:MAG TPA: FG-GAP-like repeat-containing protein, partial [Vicinamibacteria bacterium]